MAKKILKLKKSNGENIFSNLFDIMTQNDVIFYLKVSEKVTNVPSVGDVYSLSSSASDWSVLPNVGDKFTIIVKTLTGFYSTFGEVINIPSDGSDLSFAVRKAGILIGDYQSIKPYFNDSNTQSYFVDMKVGDSFSVSVNTYNDMIGAPKDSRTYTLFNSSSYADLRSIYSALTSTTFASTKKGQGEMGNLVVVTGDNPWTFRFNRSKIWASSTIFYRSSEGSEFVRENPPTTTAADPLAYKITADSAGMGMFHMSVYDSRLSSIMLQDLVIILNISE